ncbi:hypothetical protein [Streptomyces sp. OR43]|uniref:hypothetical protein n=1 Tax=Streptomyces sp. or43 TaxID=2478957 RepID=UPI0011CEAAE6|nr:hypothetical protein [Streptomyces sp. or43]TXS43878.1 hypothetical protein EAO72_09700 [Streptomyces sp. or43]
MSKNDPGTPDNTPPRPWARGNPGAGGPPRPPHPPRTGGFGGGLPPAVGTMPAPVSSLRVLMMVIGGLQAILGLALVTNSVSIATSLWGEDDTSAYTRRAAGEDHAGMVVFVGILILAVTAWGILTALKFPTRHPNVRNSAIGYGWMTLAFTVFLWAFTTVLILVLIWLAVAILLIVRPNQPECRDWFGAPRQL